MLTGALCLIAGWMATGLGELIVHRWVYHGRWRWVREADGPLRTLRGFFRAGYVHHFLVHHADARCDEASLLAEGLPAEARRAEHDARHAGHRVALHHSRYGLSGSLWGAIHHWLMLTVTPVPWAGLAVGAGLGWGFALLFLLPSILFPLSSAGYHPYLHMSAATRRRRAPGWVRWLDSTREGRALVVAHYVHHHRPPDCNYNIVPFTGWIGSALGLARPPDEGLRKRMEAIGLFDG